MKITSKIIIIEDQLKEIVDTVLSKTADGFYSEIFNTRET